MTGVEKARAWWHHHNGWIALIVLVLGAVGFGYGVGVYQRQAKLADAYNQALSAKDKLINQLAGTAVRATGQAADAADAAATAANTANSAATTAQTAAEAVQKNEKKP